MWGLDRPLWTALFQSTPVISGGRAHRQCGAKAHRSGFNPRPSFLAGEPLCAPGLGADRLVSIHARHFWRASPVGAGGEHALGHVSIHARHFWRASLAFAFAGALIALFQSTPVISGGRAGGTRRSASAYPGFNPRPSFLAGEPLTWPLKRAPVWFQSTPVISGGRATASPPTHHPSRSFNPRPSFLAGEPAYWRDVVNGIIRKFQSTPVISDGRAHDARPGLVCSAVSIHARHF